MRTLVLVWVVLLLALGWAIRADAKITRPFIGKSALKWNSFETYIVLADEDLVSAQRVINLVMDAEENHEWAVKMAKKWRLSKYSPKKRVKRILKYTDKLKYDTNFKFIKQARKARRANCTAYADIFYILCKASGIPVRYIIGYDDGIGHAWNRVKIKGTWYWVDPTMYVHDTYYGLRKRLYAGYGGIKEVW